MRSLRRSDEKKRKFNKTTDSNHQLPIAPNLLDQQFEVSSPDVIWTTDITARRPPIFGQNKGDGRPLPLYLAIVLDLFSRRIVGWSMAPTLERTLVMAALQMAIMIRTPAEGLMHHSDRGHHGMEANMLAMIIKKCYNRSGGPQEKIVSSMIGPPKRP